MTMLKLSAVYALATDVEFDVVIQGPTRQILTLIKSLGYDGVEYSILNPFEVNVRELKHLTDEIGLDVSAISTGLSYLHYGYSLSSLNAETRKKSLEFFHKYIDISADLNANKVVIGLARGECGKADCKKVKQVLKNSLEILDSYAHEKGVTLVFEPLNKYETDLINRISEAIDLIKDLKSTKLLLDTFHATLEERSVYEAIETAGPYIAHVHVADSNRRAPGMGILDWERIIYKLIKVGYRGYLSVEARAEPSFEELLRTSIKTLKPLII